jgi:FkbM family methyltransferase
VKILSNNIAILEGDTHISKWVEESRRLDHDDYSLGLILPHIKKGDWVVDGGAFIGDHTIAYLKAVGPEGKVYAFEPNPAAYSCLYHNCPDAVTFNAGLSDREYFAEYKFNPNAGASHVGRDEGNTHLFTLDSLNLRRCDFLKLDIEGCEHEALLGARETIARCRPVMWIEVNEAALARQSNTPAELLRLIESQYEYSITPYPGERGPQYDILCTPLPTS